MGPDLTKEDIIQYLTTRRAFFRNRFKVGRVALFGSFARDEQTPESDIDLLVDIVEVELESTVGLKHYLEEYFGRPVDLVRYRRNPHSAFIKKVARESLIIL